MKFRRGFIEDLTVPAVHFARHGEEVMRATSLRVVRVTQLAHHTPEVSRIEHPPGTRVWGVVHEARWTYPEARVEFLRQAPPALEPELAIGRWAVLVWAVWSGPDRRAVQEAILFAGRDYPLQTADCNVGIARSAPRTSSGLGARWRCRRRARTGCYWRTASWSRTASAPNRRSAGESS
jgi:hypothetical protein